jgi:uncharacterized protein (TIGR02996 family)
VTSFLAHSQLSREPRERAVAPAIAAPLVTPRFTVLLPLRRKQPPRVQRIEMRDPLVIGRENGVVLDDGFLGARHAELTVTADGLRIRDLDTTNGTFLNDRRVREAIVRVGDVVGIGASRLWFSHTSAGTPWPARAAPLLDTIRAAPGDDAPRLVLADLLGELGDPRGEFIICQISGAHARADELLAAHALTWGGPFTVPVHHWTFSRGFIDTIYVDDLDESDPLRVAHPLAEIRVCRPLLEP